MAGHVTPRFSVIGLVLTETEKIFIGNTRRLTSCDLPVKLLRNKARDAI